MADPISKLFSLGSKLQDLPDEKEKAISGCRIESGESECGCNGWS